MKLPDRIKHGHELLQDFELASAERYQDARELLVKGNATGATYLSGYVAEMLLKNAVFRFDGARPADRVFPRLAPAKKWAQKELPSLKFTTYHNVLFWAHVLRKKRMIKGRPLAEPIAQNLLRIAWRVERAWDVQLRYFGREVSMQAALRVFDDVTWIKKNHSHLWR
jgi:hypothetical protein